MAFRTTRDTGSTGPNPGLTPVDDIHTGSPNTEVEPDPTTGRITRRSDERRVTGKKRGNRPASTTRTGKR
jgi:hypothetical protein